MAVKPPGPVDTDKDAAPAPEKEPESHGVLGFLKELPVLIVLAFVLALLIKTFLVQAFYIPSASMEPTLVPGDRVLVNKLSPHFSPRTPPQSPRDSRYPRGAISVATRSAGPGSARAARFVHLTRRGCLSAAAQPRSEFCGATPDRASQCSRREATTATA